MNNQKNKPGRPRLSDADKKQIQRIAVDKPTYKKIKQASEKEGQTIMNVVASRFK